MSWTIKGNGSGQDLLYSQAGTPSLDLRFAATKSLTDYVTNRSLITFTRASSGTFVGSDGVLRTATTNLLLRSEEFNDGEWAAVRASISANATVAPNGTSTGDRLTEDTTASNNHFVRPSTSSNVISGRPYVFSVYAKAAGRTQLTIGFGTENSAFADSSGLFTLTGAGTAITGGSATATSIQSVGDGWYRCSVSATATATAFAFIRLLLTSSGNSIYTGDGTSGLFLWGAQLEQSSTVGEYIPTTSTINSAPRFDHNPTTGESLGLLVEEARTNLLVRSEDLTSTWLTFGTTVTANATTAPDGTTTADKLVNTTANGEHGIYQTTTTSGSNTFTVYAKQAELRYLVLRRDLTSIVAVYDLQSGTVTQTDAGVTASITAFANGWYRCSMTCSSTGNTVIKLSDVGTGVTYNSTYTGTAGQGIFIWGAQLEAGAFPTSYIPTTTAAVTRSADVASISGTAFSSWYRQDEGTVFAEMDRNTAISTSSTVVSINDNSTNNRLYNFRQDSASALTVISTTGGTLDGALGVTLANTSNRNRVAAAQSLNNLAGVANGGTVVSDTSVAIPTVNQVQIGNVTSSSYFNGTIRRLAYFPTRLGNEVLQRITQ